LQVGRKDLLVQQLKIEKAALEAALEAKELGDTPVLTDLSASPQPEHNHAIKKGL